VIGVPKGSYVPQFLRSARDANAALPAEVPLPAPALPGPPVGDAEPTAVLVTLPSTSSARSQGASARSGWPWRLRWFFASTVGAAMLAVVVVGAVLYWLGVLPSENQVARVDIFANQVPTIEVVGFTGDARGPQGVLAFSEGLRSAISMFDELRVVVNPTQMPDYRMQGTLSPNPGEVAVEANLIHVATGEIVWSFKQREIIGLLSADALLTGLQRQMATAVAQPYGIVYSHLMRRLLNANSAAASHAFDRHYACLLKAFEYWRVFTAAMHREARACLEGLAVATPGFAEAHALLTFLHLDEYRLGYNPVETPVPPLDRALQSARRAVQLDPSSPRALQALIGALFVRGQFKDARELITKVMELNPLDTDMMADMGAKLVVMGEDALGTKLLVQSATAHPSPPPWHEFFQFLSLWYRGDDAGAARHAVRIDAPEYLLGLSAKLISADAMGNQEERALLISTIARISPDFASNPVPLLMRNLPDADLVSTFVRDLRNAGLPVRPDVASLGSATTP
jgi:tetratricopeptide (TPR) repeat protein